MHLFKATSDYVFAGRAMPDFPLVLWEDMSSCAEVNEFLRFYLSRGAIESKRTWEVIGRALYDYFGFLEAHSLDWREVDRGARENLVASYGRYCVEAHALKRNTIRLRLLYVCEFYDYALHQGWVLRLPYRFELRKLSRPGAFLAHVDASGGKVAVRSVMPRKHRSLIKFLSAKQAVDLLNAAKNEHHRIIIRLALGSGLRREELASFPRCYVVDPQTLDSRAANVAVTLDPEDGTGMRTKGAKKRVIYVSRRLMGELHSYAERIRGERAANNPDGDSPALFLNELGEPWADAGKAIGAVVKKVGDSIGLHVHPHMLRHTYATHTLVRLQRSRRDSGVEPLVFLQRQLGHASIQTTMLYLHVINELADEAVLAYDAELDDWPEQDA